MAFIDKEGRDLSKPEKRIRDKYIDIQSGKTMSDHLDFFIKLRQWAFWYPDKFIDLINTNKSFNLDIDQRLSLRLFLRYHYFGLQSRGTGKTFIAYLGMLIYAMILPNVTCLYVAQTRQQSAKLLSQKHDEFCKLLSFYNDEVTVSQNSNEKFRVELPNGSIIKSGIAGNGQRGDRANMLVIDERAFIKSGVINDVLKSIVTEPRKSVKDGKPGVHEFNSIKAVTSAGYYGSEGYEEYVKKLGLMSKTHNGEMVLTSNYQLVAFADNHGYDKKGAQKFKDSMTQLEWEMNMESNWGGASTEGGIVSIDTIELSRNIEDAEHIAEDDAEYIFAYDIARNYSSKKRDDSALVIGKIIRNSNGQVGRVAVVNVLTVDAHEKFEEQAHRIKVLDELFNPKVVVIDANIIGLGVMEFLMKETKGDDKIYPAFNTLNTPEEPDTENYVNKLFALQSSRAETKQSDIVIAFMNHFRSRNVDLLTAPLNGITSAKTKDEFTQHELPHYECSRMIDELLNLQIKENKNGGVSISRATRAIDKDKAMALMYLVFYAFKKLDDDTNKKNIDVKKYLRLIR